MQEFEWKKYFMKMIVYTKIDRYETFMPGWAPMRHENGL